MAKKSFASVGVKGRPWTFFVILAVVLLATVIAFVGLTLPSLSGRSATRIRGASEIRFGIDIKGGVEAVFTPKDYEGEVTPEQMAAATRIIETRLDRLQILDREVIPARAGDRVTVRFPWKSDEKEFNPDKALRELGEMALLTFKDPDGNVVLSGKNVVKATAGLDEMSGNRLVLLELDREGAALFRDATERLQPDAAHPQGQIITINMDDTQISAPHVNEPITDGRASITGQFTAEEAIALAEKINAGALPFAMEAISSSTISPTLGQGSLRVMSLAGLVAFVLICVFMILYYRLPGVVGCVSLLAQVAGILLAISVPQQTLTLQGIAGIILSIGMGVDANIIIAERIKEEIRTGASLQISLYNGFTRAFSSVMDSNVTVAISAIILMIFGSGSMLSFGYSLLVGVILNGITGVWLTRLMIGSLASIRPLQARWLYSDVRRAGGKEAVA